MYVFGYIVIQLQSTDSIAKLCLYRFIPLLSPMCLDTLILFQSAVYTTVMNCAGDNFDCFS